MLVCLANSQEDAVQRLAGQPVVDVPTRPAIGASAKVRLPDGRTLVGQVDGGNGHSGTRSPELHFGLGDTPADKEIPVEISWRGVDGQLHSIAMQFSPGWHTLLLPGKSNPPLSRQVQATNVHNVGAEQQAAFRWPAQRGRQ